MKKMIINRCKDGSSYVETVLCIVEVIGMLTMLIGMFVLNNVVVETVGIHLFLYGGVVITAIYFAIEAHVMVEYFKSLE